MFRKQKRHVMDLVFTLGLFAVFAILSMMIVASAAQAYQSTAARMENNYMMRTSVSYITEKISQHDQSGSISMSEVEGEPAIAMEEDVDGTSYTTYIYFYDGNIRELLMKTGGKPLLRMGTAMVDADALDIEEVKEGVFRITVTDNSGLTTESFVRAVSDTI